MNIKETKSTRRVIVDILYDRQCGTSEKADHIVAYINTLVKRDKFVDRFDSIDAETEANLRRCSLSCSSICNTCTSPCKVVYKLFEWMFILMFVIFTLIALIYIIYYFVAKLT